MKYSSVAVSNVCGTSSARKTAVKYHSNRYTSTAKILALLLASNSAFGSDFGGPISPPLDIPDDCGATSLEHVVAVAAGSCVIKDIDVILAYEHDWSADLAITLTAPDGTVVGLVLQWGSSNDVVPNSPITFDDESPNPISDFSQYWNNSKVTEFQSEGGTGLVKLRDLYSEAATGNWTLIMTDNDSDSVGLLHSAILHIACEPEITPTLSGKTGKILKVSAKPTLSGKTGKILKVSAKSGVKAPHVSAKGLKIEESDSEMELFNTEGALDEVWSFANLEEQSVSMSL
jgi:subtilisin-like proprotein convertase family protein